MNPKRFFGIALFDGKLFESADGAAHFTERPLVLSDGLPRRGGAGDDNRSSRGDDRGGQDRIYATPREPQQDIRWSWEQPDVAGERGHERIGTGPL